jgi:hypothetical protein
MVAATFQPCRTKYCAVAAPMPLEAPVIKTVLLAIDITSRDLDIQQHKLWSILHCQVEETQIEDVGMQIGELSKQTGLSKDTIRFYEKIGLIAPNTKPAGTRLYKEYPPETIDWA